MENLYNIKNCKAIIFDWDGVIVDSFPVALKVYAHVFQQFHLDFNAFLRSRFGIGAKRVIQEYLDLHKIPYTEQLLTELEEQKVQAQLLLTHETNLIHGSKDGIVYLAQHFLLAIASSNDKRIIEALLKYHNLREYFSYVVACNDVKRLKPYPDLFLKAAQTLKIPPKDCFVIEDSLPGIAAAHIAGMRVIGIATGTTSYEALKEKADFTFHSLSDFISEHVSSTLNL